MTARRLIAVASEVLKLTLILVIFGLLGALLGSPL